MNIEMTAKLPVETERTQAERRSRNELKESTTQRSLGSEKVVAQEYNKKQDKSANDKQSSLHTEMEPKDIAAAVDELNKAIPLQARQLHFEINEDANRTVISVLDKESGDVIRQIPSEEALALAIRLREASQGAKQSVGILLDSKI